VGARLDAAATDTGSPSDSPKATDGAPTDDAAMAPDGPAPPGSIRLVGGRARLVGQLANACSNEVPASGNGHRWCAFSLPARIIGKTELWVVDVTSAAAGAVKCDGSDPGCLRLADDLWTAQPMGNVPKNPSTHRFEGDTLIFHASANMDVSEYKGPIFAWRPGWNAAKQISGSAGFTCSTSGGAYLCMENLTDLMVTPFQFDLTGGVLAGNGPVKLGRITPARPGTMSSQWRMAISRGGDTLAWSTGGTTLAEPEKLFAIKVADLPDVTRTQTVAARVSRWALSADGVKVYYLRDYNYPALGGDPSGTLAMADFPSGGNEVVLAPMVASLQALSSAPGVDGGIGFLDGLKAGLATFKLLRDRSRPTEITTVVQGIPGTTALSPDLRFLYYFKQSDPDTGLTDGYIARTDGSGVTCALTTTVTSSGFFGPAFTASSGLVLWADNIDVNTGVADGWAANPDGCTGKRKWGERVDFWFLRRPGAAAAGSIDGMVFTDGAMDPDTASLKATTFPGGTTVGVATLVAAQISRTFAPLPALEGVLFTLPPPLQFPSVDGIYYLPVHLGP
jgi:hypothetical protein